MELADKFNLLHPAKREAENARSRFGLLVPFETRDGFKATFPDLYERRTDEKLWSLQPAQRERLEEWMALDNPIRAASAIATAAHLSVREIKQTRDEIEEQRANLGDIAAKHVELKAMLLIFADSHQVLKAERDKLDLAAADMAREEREADEQRAGNCITGERGQVWFPMVVKLVVALAAAKPLV